MNKIQNILADMVRLQASDLFVTVGRPPILKISGNLHELGEYGQFVPADTEMCAQQLFDREQSRQAFAAHGEADFSLSLSHIGRFRVNVFRQRGSCAITVRRIYSQLPDPVELGIPDTVMGLTSRQKGLVLVTGPAGCGKTTTLAALIDKINQERACHILTLEDPIEFLHSHRRSIINQREIGTDSESYAQALRAALRQSPDVILIGEMRDLETISIALTAAETGHLVLSTLHTVGAAKTVDRIIDVFPSSQQQQVRVQLSTVLQAVVSQQLLPGIDGSQQPAFEIMLANPAVRNMIRDGKTPQIDGVIQMHAAAGMLTMEMSLARLLREGQISREDAFFYAVNQEALTRLVSVAAPDRPDSTNPHVF
ncbi:MAG: PilT/PilU family type 4a pilus ATPase [Clostridiaceae bacterium]|jgi:twitching motility protein PilT|nr:PilT/PilU family type 4a pilus ATPase [Clostridiaceae bacterium]